MTSPAIKLARECGIYGGKVQNIEGEEGYWVNDVSEKTMERFYAKAQAQALRDAAAWFERNGWDDVQRELRRMAEELERGA